MNFTRFIAASDVHGDMKDDAAIEVLMDFTSDFKPHVKLFLGDLWDFRPLRGKADEKDRRDNIKEDFSEGMKFLRDWRPHHFIQGNHDFRLYNIAERGTGMVQQAAKDGIADIEKLCKKLRCEIHPYHRERGVVSIGLLKFLHGFYCGKTATSRHLSIYHHCVFGHTHGIDVARGPSLYGVEHAHNIGCLCSLDMDYDAQRPDGLAQEHGFAYGWINTRTGSYRLEQARPVDGMWMLPTEFKEYR